MNFRQRRDIRFGLFELPFSNRRVLGRFVIRREQVSESLKDVISVLVQCWYLLLELLELGQGQLAVDRCPAKSSRMDRRELFDEPLDELGRVDTVRTSKPLAELIDIRDIGKHIGKDAVLDAVDPGLLDGIPDNRLPIEQIRIELGRQIGRFVFLWSRVGSIDSESALKVFDRGVGVRCVLKQRLARFHALRQIAGFMFRYPFSQQASGLGNTPLVLGMKNLEEKIFRRVGNKLPEGLRTLFTQGKAFEKPQRLSGRGSLNPLGLHLSHLRRKAQQEKTDEDEDWLHIGTKSGFEVSSTRV